MTARRTAWVAFVTGLLGACSATTTSDTTDTIEAIAGDLPVPATGSSVRPVAATTPEATARPAAGPAPTGEPAANPALATTTTFAVAPSTSVIPEPAPRTRIRLERPAGTVAVFSDSTFADQTGDFQLFDLVREGLLALDIGVDDVRNYAVPGQGVIDGLEITEPGWHRLGSYLEAVSDDPYLAQLDLAIIASGRVDVNRLGRDTEMGELGRLIADELAAVVAGFEASGTRVVLLPAFGANDEMFDALQCAAGRCDPQRSDAKFEALNAAIVDAGLPMLFDRYSGTDLDDVPGTDRSWFVDFDPAGRWPDDGQHPNPAGEQLIADQVLFHLAVAFGAEPPTTLPTP